MTDLMPKRPADASTDNSGQDDPLAHLHKMSTTAGLGTTEYVAINPLAVATVFLGLASALALLDNTLLAVPVLAVVMAIVSLRQISHSGGTQTGRGLAILGLVLAIAFSGVVLARSLVHQFRTRQDTQQIDALVKDVSDKIAQGNPDAAYGSFSERFTARFTRDEFNARWQAIKKYGLKSLQSNGRLSFRVDPDTGQTTAQGMAITEFASTTSPEDRIEVFYRKQPGGNWTIDAIPQFFNEQAAKPGAK